MGFASSAIPSSTGPASGFNQRVKFGLGFALRQRLLLLSCLVDKAMACDKLVILHETTPSDSGFLEKSSTSWLHSVRTRFRAAASVVRKAKVLVLHSCAQRTTLSLSILSASSVLWRFRTADQQSALKPKPMYTSTMWVCCKHKWQDSCREACAVGRSDHLALCDVAGDRNLNGTNCVRSSSPASHSMCPDEGVTTLAAHVNNRRNFGHLGYNHRNYVVLVRVSSFVGSSNCCLNIVHGWLRDAFAKSWAHKKNSTKSTTSQILENTCTEERSTDFRARS